MARARMGSRGARGVRLMRIIEPASWVAQPWKNGAGTTHELVRWPDEGPFAVRISVAEITAPAPFSAFAGYRRWLYLLDGGPVTLAIEGADHVLAAAGDGVAFPGEARVAATEVARASRDLNFMVAADRAVRCEIVRGPTRQVLAERIVAVFALAGDVTVARHALGADLADASHALEHHACAWTTDEALDLALGEGATAAVLAVT